MVAEASAIARRVAGYRRRDRCPHGGALRRARPASLMIVETPALLPLSSRSRKRRLRSSNRPAEVSRMSAPTCWRPETLPTIRPIRDGTPAGCLGRQLPLAHRALDRGAGSDSSDRLPGPCRSRPRQSSGRARFRRLLRERSGQGDQGAAAARGQPFRVTDVETAVAPER